MSKVAFIGLGAMGIGMAARMVEAGFEVTVYNRTQDKTVSLKAMGASVATSPKEAVNGAEAIFSMVSDNWASYEVWLGEDGVLQGEFAPGALAVECSTLSHDWVLELAEKVSTKGLRYIDAPVTGLPEAAAAGDLVLFVGSKMDDLDEARHFLVPLCKEIMHFGGVGTGTAYKLIVNLMGAVQIAAVAEGLVMAEKAGLELGVVVNAISTGQAAAPQVVRNVKRMAMSQHDSNLVFSGSMRLKDALYGVQLAQSLGASSDFGNVAAGCFQELDDKGFGELNECKVVDVLRAKLN